MALGCANLESLNYSNFNDDICYVYGLSRTPAGLVTIRRVPFVAPDTGSFPLGQIFSGARDKQDGFNTTGKVNASSLGNEVVSDQSTSVSFRADTVYNALTPAVLPSTVNRNTLVAMLEGSGIEGTSSLYEEMISISGARLTCPLDVTEAKWLFYRDGYFVIDGKKKNSTTGEPEVRKNPYIDKYNKTDICTMMELYVAPTAETSNDVTYRFPFVSSNNINFAEADDANKFTADCMFISDRINALQSLADGFSDNEVDTIATAGVVPIYKVNVDYIICVAGGTKPTVAGASGDTAIVIDTTDDTVEIFKYAATWEDVPVTSVLGQGFVAWSNVVCTNLLCTTFVSATGDAYLMAVKTAGATSAAVAAVNGTNNVFAITDLITDDADRSALWENHNV